MFILCVLRNGNRSQVKILAAPLKSIIFLFVWPKNSPARLGNTMVLSYTCKCSTFLHFFCIIFLFYAYAYMPFQELFTNSVLIRGSVENKITMNNYFKQIQKCKLQSQKTQKLAKRIVKIVMQPNKISQFSNDIKRLFIFHVHTYCVSAFTFHIPPCIVLRKFFFYDVLSSLEVLIIFPVLPYIYKITVITSSHTCLKLQHPISTFIFLN